MSIWQKIKAFLCGGTSITEQFNQILEEEVVVAEEKPVQKKPRKKKN